jgi:hypothetical protein
MVQQKSLQLKQGRHFYWFIHYYVPVENFKET